MIRANYHGLSTAVDYHGNILAQMNDFTTKETIMIADLPNQGIRTIYSQIGNSLAWLCVLGLLGLIALAAKNGKKIQ
jgi:apolipoprotein N-acyltransferase